MKQIISLIVKDFVYNGVVIFLTRCKEEKEKEEKGTGEKREGNR